MTDILTGTPPYLTYLHPFIQQAWLMLASPQPFRSRTAADLTSSAIGLTSE